MSYKPTELPESVKHVLPKHAQHIYHEAFNHAWDEYKDDGKKTSDESREVIAHKVAWSAVKKQYKKNEATGKWEAFK